MPNRLTSTLITPAWRRVSRYLRLMRAGVQRCNYWLSPVVDIRLLAGLSGYRRYMRDWLAYSRLPEAEPLRLRDALPMLYDRTLATPFDRHYLYQSVWASRAIRQAETTNHVDVGSWVVYVSLLTAFVYVVFVDIRPVVANLRNLQTVCGSISNLPFGDNSVESISCLHVAEHIGLGRYGDPLDPGGTKKAARELARVLAWDGNLYFSLPVGKPRVCFNAHRVHSPQQILDYFENLRLAGFSAVTDEGDFAQDADPADFTSASYACGLFHFMKEKDER